MPCLHQELYTFSLKDRLCSIKIRPCVYIYIIKINVACVPLHPHQVWHASFLDRNKTFPSPSNLSIIIINYLYNLLVNLESSQSFHDFPGARNDIHRDGNLTIRGWPMSGSCGKSMCQKTQCSQHQIDHAARDLSPQPGWGKNGPNGNDSQLLGA